MKAFLTRPTYDTPRLIERLREAGIELEVRHEATVCPQALLREKARGVNALLTHTEDQVDAELFDAASRNLRVVANMGIGFSNIDISAAREHSVFVTNTPTDEAFEATAEATVALLLSIARRIPALHMERRAMTEDPAPSFLRPTATSVRSKVTGIVGFGRIGSRVARIMHAGFNNRILYYDVYSKPELEDEIGAEQVDLATLMRQSDFICINMPLSEESKGLISSEMIALMQPGSTLINTARAGLIDEKALVARLNEGSIHGAGLDVYSDQVNDISAENIALTSHFANFEDRAYSAMTELVASNVISCLTQGKAITPVALPG